MTIVKKRDQEAGDQLALRLAEERNKGVFDCLSNDVPENVICQLALAAHREESAIAERAAIVEWLRSGLGKRSANWSELDDAKSYLADEIERGAHLEK